jgi:hypothetical protein
MTKRVLAGFLWFYSGWYAGAMVAHALNISDALGLIVGVAAAGVFAGDPFGLIWARRVAPPDAVATRPVQARTTAAEEA